jgi:methylenetetrahydrofolate dehydrogenase (NADP+)/methenyltetrahydrofolate cyclohydrolase
MSKIIDGKLISQKIRTEIRQEIEKLTEATQQPGLAVILVGENPASQVYVKMKAKACEEVGINSITKRLPADVTEAELLKWIEQYNRSKKYHGLLVQLPLPPQINEQKVIETIRPHKDVDCFHPYNVGRLMIGQPTFQPATPAGVLELLKYSHIDTTGKHIVILGRSNIVGKPLSMMLLQKQAGANAIVTVAHTAAKDISSYTSQADILVAAMGKPELVRGNMVKKGAVVIDVGVNRVEAENEKGYRLVGDVAFEEVYSKASAITPVPGGVGPMTIAMLLKNTLKAYQNQKS